MWGCLVCVVCAVVLVCVGAWSNCVCVLFVLNCVTMYGLMLCGMCCAGVCVLFNCMRVSL